MIEQLLSLLLLCSPKNTDTASLVPPVRPRQQPTYQAQESHDQQAILTNASHADNSTVQVNDKQKALVIIQIASNKQPSIQRTQLQADDE